MPCGSATSDRYSNDPLLLPNRQIGAYQVELAGLQPNPEIRIDKRANGVKSVRFTTNSLIFICEKNNAH